MDKKYVMQLLRERFRDYKAHFKSQYYDPASTPKIIIAKGGPTDMPVNQFADIVAYWYSSKGKVIMYIYRSLLNFY